MSHPFYYIKKCQRVSPTVRHTGNYQNSSNWSLLIIFSWSWDRPENPYLKMVHPKALEYIYVFHMIYTIEWKTCIKSLINITLFSKINLFLQQSVTKMTVTCYIFIKSPTNRVYLIESDQSLPFPLPQCIVKPQMPCQAVLTRNEQPKLQSTLNKGGGGVSLTIL